AIGTVSIVLYLGLQLLRIKRFRPRSIPITLIIFVVTFGFLTAWKLGYESSQDLFNSTETAFISQTKHAYRGGAIRTCPKAEEKRG
ncbi:MAG: hypothetical protein NXI32_30695, partial [bacterium]|nr:hypothetical protein [bacterium]